MRTARAVCLPPPWHIYPYTYCQLDLKKRHTFRNIFPILLIIPALIPLVAIILVPAIRTVHMSFHRVSYGLPEEYLGGKNFTDMFNDPAFGVAFWHTILFSFSTVTGEILLGLVAAVLLSTRFRFQKLYIAILMIPYAASEVVAIIIWKYMLEPDIGIINYVLHGILGLGQIEWASNPVQAWVFIIVLRIWINSPFSAVRRSAYPQGSFPHASR